MRAARLILLRELREALRDRRALLSALLFAFWSPIALGIVLQAVARDRDPAAPVSVRVRGLERAPFLEAFLVQRGVDLEPSAGRLEAVAEGGGIALELPAGLAEDLRELRPAKLRLIYDSTRVPEPALERVRAALAELDHLIAARRLILRGVAPSIVQPLERIEVDLAGAARRSARYLLLFPVFLLLTPFVCAMNVAIDTTAGERERGALEALLLTPAARGALVVGKWAAGTIVALASVAIHLAMIGLVLTWPRLQQLEVPIGLTGADAIALGLNVAPLALLAPALQMLVASGARSFREAQGWLSGLLLIPTLPGFLSAVGSLEITGARRFVPFVGHDALTSSVLRGEPWSAIPCLALAAVTWIALAAALILLARRYASESFVCAR